MYNPSHYSWFQYLYPLLTKLAPHIRHDHLIPSAQKQHFHFQNDNLKSQNQWNYAHKHWSPYLPPLDHYLERCEIPLVTHNNDIEPYLHCNQHHLSSLLSIPTQFGASGIYIAHELMLNTNQLQVAMIQNDNTKRWYFWNQCQTRSIMYPHLQSQSVEVHHGHGEHQRTHM